MCETAIARFDSHSLSICGCYTQGSMLGHVNVFTPTSLNFSFAGSFYARMYMNYGSKCCRDFSALLREDQGKKWKLPRRICFMQSILGVVVVDI